MVKKLLTMSGSLFLTSTPRAMGQRLSRSVRLVGGDQFGNRYYERVASESGERTKRWMQPPGWFTNNPLKYDPDKVPAGWRSWLAFQRDQPPE